MMMGGRNDEYDDILKDVENARITAWWDRAVDIIPVNGGKGKGIEAILEYYGIDRSESMAFGDGGMISKCFKLLEQVLLWEMHLIMSKQLQMRFVVLQQRWNLSLLFRKWLNLA